MIGSRAINAIIAIAILLFLLYRYNRSAFWKYQSVSRNNSKKGIIMNISLLPIMPINHNLSWTLLKESDIGNIQHFLKNNYMNSQTFSLSYLEWSLSLNPAYFISINENRIIATLLSRLITLSVDNSKHPVYYVDYGAIHKDYRSQNLFPQLISKTLQNMKDNHIQFALHKKESVPLKHNHFALIWYHVLKNPKSNPTNSILKNDDIDAAHSLFAKSNRKYRIHVEMDRNYFSNFFMNSNAKTFYEKDAFASFCMSNYNGTEIPELMYFIGDVNFFSKCASTFSSDYILIQNMANNRQLLDYFNSKKTVPSFYYFYNYSLPQVESHEFNFYMP